MAARWSGGDVSENLTTGQWGRIIQTGILVDEDGGFAVSEPDTPRSALADADDRRRGRRGRRGWGRHLDDVGQGRDRRVAEAVRRLLHRTGPGGRRRHHRRRPRGPAGHRPAVRGGVLVVALLTGLYSTLLQANLMDTDMIAERQEEMQAIRERRKEAKERGDDEALERIQQERLEAMDLSLFTAQFRPMVWIMLLTIPLFLWMYWIIRDGAMGTQTVVFPLAGEIQWNAGVLGPIRAWIVWYFLCSMGFSQIIRKSLDLQTTPT